MNDNKNEIVAKRMADIEFYPEIIEESDADNIGIAETLPWSDVLALGAGFEPIVSAFNKVMNNQPELAGKLYEVIIPKGGHLATLKKENANIGAVLSDAGNKLMGQARLHEVDVPMKNPLEINPAMIVIAVALMGIEHKLGEIEETQKEILRFLKNKEKAELKGSLITLSDILKNYKYNWNNEMFRTSNHTKVLDIKQKAEESIIFHRKNIEDNLKKKKLVQVDKDVKGKLKAMRSELEDYQLAVYLFGMSSYLDVMFLENFESAFIRGVVNKIEDYSYRYRELYTSVYEQLDREADKTVQNALIGGLGKAVKASGEAIAKVPVISRGPVDEQLIKVGKTLKHQKEIRTDRRLGQLSARSSSNVSPFVENLNMIDRLNNEPMKLIFDQEKLCIAE